MSGMKRRKKIFYKLRNTSLVWFYFRIQFFDAINVFQIQCNSIRFYSIQYQIMGYWPIKGEQPQEKFQIAHHFQILFLIFFSNF